MTYTKQHAANLKKLHDRDPNFGVIGHLWSKRVHDYMEMHDCISLLDYGCGRSELIYAVKREGIRIPEGKYAFQQYDPAIFPERPIPADFVTCIDVLEHVEAHKLFEVLKDIGELMNKAGLITVSLRNGTKRNQATHQLAAKPRQFWLDHLGDYFPTLKEVPILDPSKAASELAVLVRKTW